eukprot:12209679-Alexandrium_andersonii.AAC.1
MGRGDPPDVEELEAVFALLRRASQPKGKGGGGEGSPPDQQNNVGAKGEGKGGKAGKSVQG